MDRCLTQLLSPGDRSWVWSLPRVRGVWNGCCKVSFPSDGRVSDGLRELVLFTLEQDPLKRPFVGEVLERAIALGGTEVNSEDQCGE